jgi:hypothetical protein
MNGNDEPLVDHRGTSNRCTIGRALADPGTARPGKIPEIDEMAASLQAGFRGLTEQYSSADLIAEARRLNARLFEPEEDVGPLEKSAIAATLIRMHSEMEHRITAAAAAQRKWPPVLPGVEWRKDDPLAGVVEGLPPFHMVDWWSGFALETASARRTRATLTRAPPASIVPRRQSERPPEGATPVPKPPPRVREVIAEKVGKPKRYGPDPEKWWQNIGVPSLSPDPPFTKVTKMLVRNLVNARLAGVERSARRYVRAFTAAGIASMAAGLPTTTIRRRVDPETGLPIFVYPPVPKPSGEWVTPALRQQMNLWLNPSDPEAFDKGRQRGLAAAKAVIEELDQLGGGGVRYLIYLNQRFKGDRTEIYRHMFVEIGAAESFE